MKLLNLTVILFVLVARSHAQPISREEYLKKYDERVQYMVSLYDTASGASFNAIAVRYAHNHDLARADSMFKFVLKNPSGDMFWMYPCINAYAIGKDRMSAETKAVVRNAWKTYAPYRGDTENHWAMYYASLYIAAEQWPGLGGSEWYNGKSSDENRIEARDYLIHWIKITTTIGQGEFDSPDYFPEYINAMQLLATFAQDQQMRQRGVMMMDYLLADFATEHLDGQYLGGYSRIYEPAVYKPYNSPASAFAYLYFGGGIPSQSSWATFCALAPYRLPQIIYYIATDRSKTFVEKERKRVRNVIRFGDVKNPPVYKYTYVTKDYGIGSLQGGIQQPIQQHTWGVRYTFGRPYTTIFGLHPYWSSMELGMFFGEEIKPLIADVVASKGTYNNPDKWTGSSPFERTFQHLNTLIVLYDIAPGTTSEHIDGFFPANLEQRIIDPSGWIICKAGDTYIGWYPLQEYEWMPQKPIDNRQGSASQAAPNKNENEFWRLRSYKLQNGYVIETRSKAEIGSFEKFKSALRSHIPKPMLNPGAVSVRYTTLQNEKMYFSFPNVRTLNGKAVDLTKTKLFDGPFLHAEVGSEMLIMTYKNMKRVLDFKNVKTVE